MLGDTQLLLQSIGSLLLVLAILLVMVFAARWFMQRRPQGGRRLRFIEAMALGSRDKLLLVEVDGKSLLLGVTAQNIRLLADLGAVEALPKPLDPQEEFPLKNTSNRFIPAVFSIIGSTYPNCQT